MRGRQIGYIPQDPMTNLNPVWKIGFQIREALRANTSDRDTRRRAVQLLEADLPDRVQVGHRVLRDVADLPAAHRAQCAAGRSATSRRTR
ncbi:hypothetical protein MAHJHV33_48400 [Mycobacterium avium subsp. hominissuis]